MTLFEEKKKLFILSLISFFAFFVSFLDEAFSKMAIHEAESVRIIYSYLDTDTFFSEKARSMLDETVSCVFDQTTLEEVVNFLNQRFDLNFRVDSSVCRRKLSLILTDKPLSFLLKKIEELTQTFFVLRNNYVLLTDQVTYLLYSDRVLDLAFSKFLYQRLKASNNKFRAFIDSNSILIRLDYSSRIRFRNLILEKDLDFSIKATDALIDQDQFF